MPGKVTFPGAGGTESTLVPPATFLRAVLAGTKWRPLSWQISGQMEKGRQSVMSTFKPRFRRGSFFGWGLSWFPAQRRREGNCHAPEPHEKGCP